MYSVQITPQLYGLVKSRAEEQGFANVDEYVKDILTEELSDPGEPLTLSPERFAHIDQSLEEGKSGMVHSVNEVREHFKKRFE